TVQGTPAPLSVGEYGDDHDDLRYSINWYVVTDTHASGGKYHQITSDGREVSFNVDGTAAALDVLSMAGSAGFLEVIVGDPSICTIAQGSGGHAAIALIGSGIRSVRLVVHQSGSNPVTL